MRKRFDYIDALRGWAIFGVIVTHVSSLINYEGVLTSLTGRGGLGVQLFFMISAFTIFHSLDNSKGKENFPVSNFFIKRLLRIAPVYWLGIIVYSLIFGLGSRGWLPGPELWHYPLHFTFTNLFHPESPSSVVPGGWSISCEVIFYFLCPILFALIRDIKSAIYFSIITVAGGIAFLKLTDAYLINEMSKSFGQKLSEQYFYRSIISQIGCFSFGILFFHIGKSGKLNKYLEIKSFSKLLLFIGAIGLVIMYVLKPGYHYVAGFSFLCIALSVSKRDNFFIVNRPIIFLGKISFSAYISHFLIIYFLKNLFFIENFYTLTLLTFIIVVPISFLLHLYVEKTFIGLGRTWISRREKPVVTLTAN
ncbi:hypothetical protein RJ41_17960 [Alteromonas marina]|uniref:Acyltransferase 3 domain-containing protein n=1 Tax=Alteromonas marina TaxID=203795 RepID=A0A0B3Y5W9_9ALTE|nr:acyltransferase [Alteromonas marina]KHT44123.1 hypothetical protein RJ41_17960 [Alteromonas marina]